jgi:hypothetical protein
LVMAERFVLALTGWNSRASRRARPVQTRGVNRVSKERQKPADRQNIRCDVPTRAELQMWNRRGSSDTGQPFDSNCLVVARRTELE